MILLLAVAAGLVFGLGRAWIGQRRLDPPALHYLWLVVVAVLPQWFTFYWPVTQTAVPDPLAAVVLLLSQSLLLVFAWLNRHKPGFWALGVGLALNLLVISLNGGLMPVNPETLTRLYPEAGTNAWPLYQRLWGSKEIVLPVSETNLWWLSDVFTLPAWINYRVAFSVGDILIAVGAFWLLWVSGGSKTSSENQVSNHEQSKV